MIHVAVAVIYDAIKNEILVAKRQSDKHQGGKWEFPGGKVEIDEPVTVALAREVKEELAIDVDISETHKLQDVRFSYDDIDVWLDVWWVNAFSGQPRGAEGQLIQWVSVDALKDIDFPEANQQILTAITQELAAIESNK